MRDSPTARFLRHGLIICNATMHHAYSLVKTYCNETKTSASLTSLQIKFLWNMVNCAGVLVSESTWCPGGAMAHNVSGQQLGNLTIPMTRLQAHPTKPGRWWLQRMKSSRKKLVRPRSITFFLRTAHVRHLKKKAQCLCLDDASMEAALALARTGSAGEPGLNSVTLAEAGSSKGADHFFFFFFWDSTCSYPVSQSVLVMPTGGRLVGPIKQHAGLESAAARLLSQIRPPGAWAPSGAVSRRLRPATDAGPNSCRHWVARDLHFFGRAAVLRGIVCVVKQLAQLQAAAGDGSLIQLENVLISFHLLQLSWNGRTVSAIFSSPWVPSKIRHGILARFLATQTIGRWQLW